MNILRIRKDKQRNILRMKSKKLNLKKALLNQVWRLNKEKREPDKNS